MKILAIIIGIALLFVTSGVIHAGQFGPHEPVAKEKQVSLGIGYFYHGAKWKSKDAGLDDITTKQNEAYLQLSYSFTKNWESYLRIGGADVKTDITLLDRNFKDGFKPFGTLGIKGLFYNSPSFGIGSFLQTNLYSSYKDEEVEEFSVAGIVIGRGTRKVKLKNPWDINLGIAVQTKLGEAILYGGPIAYWARSKVEREVIAAGTTKSTFTIKEKNNLGGFAGLRLPLGKKVNFEVEGQLKSKFSFGASLSYSF